MGPARFALTQRMQGELGMFWQDFSCEAQKSAPPRVHSVLLQRKSWRGRGSGRVSGGSGEAPVHWMQGRYGSSWQPLLCTAQNCVPPFAHSLKLQV